MRSKEIDRVDHFFLKLLSRREAQPELELERSRAEEGGVGTAGGLQGGTLRGGGPGLVGGRGGWGSFRFFWGNQGTLRASGLHSAALPLPSCATPRPPWAGVVSQACSPAQKTPWGAWWPQASAEKMNK